jgi:hypothetical protein
MTREYFDFGEFRHGHIPGGLRHDGDGLRLASFDNSTSTSASLVAKNFL